MDEGLEVARPVDDRGLDRLPRDCGQPHEEQHHVRAQLLPGPGDEHGEGVQRHVGEPGGLERNVGQREEIVDDLVANSCCWEKEDVETLNTLSDDKLVKLRDHTKKDEQLQLVANAAQKEFVDEVLLRAEEILEYENAEREAIRNGMPIDEVYDTYGDL